MKHDADAELKAAVIPGWLEVVLVPLSSVLDRFIYPEWFVRFLLMCCGAVVVFTGTLQHGRFAQRKHPRISLFLLAFSLTAMFSIMANLSGKFSRNGSSSIVKIINSGTLISENTRLEMSNKFLTPEKQSAYHKGLGLNYSRMMCSLHGGEIEYSVEREMNTFTVRMPLEG